MEMKDFELLFIALCANYCEKFDYMYPCPGKNGLAEANLTASLVNVVTTIPGLEDAKCWNEFPVFRGKEDKYENGNIDCVIVSRSSKTIIIFEAKNFETNLHKKKMKETAIDMDRIVRTAYNPLIFPKRLWNESHTKKLADEYKDWAVYGLVCGGFWLENKQPNSIIAKERLYKALTNVNPRLVELDRENCRTLYIDVKHPGFNGRTIHYLGCYFWTVKDRGVEVNPKVAMLPNDTSLASLLHEACLAADIDCGGETLWYLYPPVLEKWMPTGDYHFDDISVWLKTSGEPGPRLSVIVAAKNESIKIVPPSSETYGIEWKKATKPQYGSISTWKNAFAAEIGLLSDVHNDEGREKLKTTLNRAIDSFSGFQIK